MMNSDNNSINITKSISAACLANAKDLIRAAKIILDKENLPNIAYHLATIAMEEVGKASLIVLKNRAVSTKIENNFSDKRFGDHVAKLFWAL